MQDAAQLEVDDVRIVRLGQHQCQHVGVVSATEHRIMSMSMSLKQYILVPAKDTDGL